MLVDRELNHLPPEARWREWMHRVEATTFAASEPVTRSILARVVGKDCNLDLLIDDIREKLRGRPYDLVAVAGGFLHVTRPAYAIRAAVCGSEKAVDLTQSEVLVLMALPIFSRSRVANCRAFWQRDFPRSDRCSVRRQPDRLRPAQSHLRRALHLRHHQNLPRPLLARHAARLRGARGCQAAVEGEAAGRGYSHRAEGLRRER